MISVAIDGPAGAGKSTIAKKIAENMGYIYVDTGALYRTVALSLINNGISSDDVAAVEKHLEKINVDLCYINGEQRVLLNGTDVSSKIRTPEVSMMASTSSALPVVRAFLLELQRKMAVEHDVVMDGRDIGTYVLPDANYKFFITATAEERANRRFKELQEKGQQISYEEVLTDIVTRDKNDSTRAFAPLKKADDAHEFDTTTMSIDEVVAELLNRIK